jgi:hypothetical protein
LHFSSSKTQNHTIDSYPKNGKILEDKYETQNEINMFNMRDQSEASYGHSQVLKKNERERKDYIERVTLRRIRLDQKLKELLIDQQLQNQTMVHKLPKRL